ncbi:MAG: PrgI family protein [Candidatus Pacebacteria bacterium]|nr:PrgI family protein [Candidatus Paceibacterota bacterium]MDD5356819.1 PrgI family protein [Candidatus Paceibacterota bacterium]
MQFQVPQFIEIEDKVFGPLTVKQFLYLAGGAGFSYLLYAFLPSYISYALMLLVAGFSLALAFYKVNEKPFILIVEAAFNYLFSKKLYIWKRQDKKIEKKEEVETSQPTLRVPKLSDSKLSDLSWSLDINEREKGTIYSKETKTLGRREDR